MNMKIVVFTGAGISAESGLGTFRDSGGIWEKFRIEDVCTPDAWQSNPEYCVEFYNLRRRDALAAQPNTAHFAITKLQEVFPNTQIITQNIDNLHERAGSNNVLHLHGEITKLRSQKDPSALVELAGWEQHYGDRHADGSILRPHVVFFGEDVPNFTLACEIVSQADILIVIGTSLNVYPAASLLTYAPVSAEIYLIDPNEPTLGYYTDRVGFIQAKATEGVPALVDALIETYK